MLDLLKKDDLVSLTQLNELLRKFSAKEEETKKTYTTALIVSGIVLLSLVAAGLIVYKVFFSESSELDDFDEFDEDFDDMDYDDDYDDFEDYDEDEEDIEDDFEGVEDEEEKPSEE